jgi:MATE family multidrug resistance protein
VSAAGSIRVGQNLGAARPAGVRRSVAVTYALAVGFMALCALAFLTIPDALLGLYSHDPSILQLGRQLLFMAALFQIFDGMQVSGFSVLRGAADTRVPMFLAALAYWVVGAPGAYLLAFHTTLGPVGIWAGLCLGLAAAAVLLLGRVRRVLGESAKFTVHGSQQKRAPGTGNGVRTGSRRVPHRDGTHDRTHDGTHDGTHDRTHD